MPPDWISALTAPSTCSLSQCSMQHSGLKAPGSFMNTEAETVYGVSALPDTEPHALFDLPDRSRGSVLALSSLRTIHSLVQRSHPFLWLLLPYLC